ncbi:MAG: hypothetical protein ABSC35_11790 [Candidatus Dormibacteria bacterium]|jgi:hypothetical protein
MTLQPLHTPVPGRVGGSTVIVLAIRGDASTGQVEVAEVHDVSLAVGDIPEHTTRRLVPAADFRPWPQRTAFIGGQPFVYQWVSGHARCARCDAELEHFAYTGRSGGDVREHGQGSGPPIWYCESCVRGPLDLALT